MAFFAAATATAAALILALDVLLLFLARIIIAAAVALDVDVSRFGGSRSMRSGTIAPRSSGDSMMRLTREGRSEASGVYAAPAEDSEMHGMGWVGQRAVARR